MNTERRKKATAVSSTQLTEKRVIEALSRVNHFISYVTDLHKLLELIMKESKKVLDATSSSLMLYDPEKNDLFFEVALGKKGEKIKNIVRLALGQGIAGHAAKSRKTVIVNNAKEDKRHFQKADIISRFKTRNLIAAPMERGKNLIGVLEVLNKKAGDFTEEDARILDLIADSAAIAIENARLIEANLRAERLAAMGQAVAGISHYVKNILAGTKGSASLIEMGLQNKNMDIIEQTWPILSRSTRKINNLVQDMLTYSKQRKLDLEPVDPNTILAEILAMCDESAREQDVELKSRLSEKCPTCMIETSSFQDAALNLVGNAIEATSGVDGGWVCVSSSVDTSTAEVAVRVEDNGYGIAEEQLERIFDPFFSTKGSKGTGLGLAVTKKVIEEHHGRIVVESEVGKGTAFSIYLPYGPS